MDIEVKRPLSFNYGLLAFGLPASIFVFVILLTQTSFYRNNTGSLAIGITADLLLTAPLVYFLFIRKTSIPNITVIPVLFLGILLGTKFLTEQDQSALLFFRSYGIPIVELFVLSYVIIKLRSASKAFKEKSSNEFDFFTILKATCEELLPKRAVLPVTTEIAVFYYGFISWRRRKYRPNEYSYHLKSGSITLLIALLFIVGIETYVIHVLLMKWSEVAALALSILSVYTALQVFGFLKSMIKRPITFEGDILHLRYGIVNEAQIPLAEIEAIALHNTDLELDHETRKLSFLGQLEGHNILIKLKNKQTLHRLYGIKRSFKRMAFFVDDKHRFIKDLEAKLVLLNPE